MSRNRNREILDTDEEDRQRKRSIELFVCIQSGRKHSRQQKVCFWSSLMIILFTVSKHSCLFMKSNDESDNRLVVQLVFDYQMYISIHDFM